MTVTSALCLLLSAGILYWVVRCRVHITVSYSPTARKIRRPRRKAEPAAVPHQDTAAVLTGALIGLGCHHKAARAAAARAIKQATGPETLPDLLKRAIREATAAA